jgi:hypothetical protein
MSVRKLILASLFLVIVYGCSNPSWRYTPTATKVVITLTIPIPPSKTPTETPTIALTRTFTATPNLHQNCGGLSSFTLTPTSIYTPTQTLHPIGTPSTSEDKPELRSLG